MPDRHAELLDLWADREIAREALIAAPDDAAALATWIAARDKFGPCEEEELAVIEGLLDD